MKFKVSEVIHDLENKPIKEQVAKGEKESFLTMDKLIVNSLLGVLEGNRISGEDKFKRFCLSNKIYKKEVVELGVDEIKLIKDLAGELLNPYQAGKVWEFLEKPLAEEAKVEEPKA